MNKKILTAGIVAVTMVPLATAIDLSTDEVLGLMPWMTFECTDGGPNTASYPDPLDPEVTVHVSLYCVGDEVLDGHFGTDCTSDSYSFWIGPQSKRWDYRYATSNNDGLSSSAVISAWNAANNVWDNQVAADIWGTYTTGGSGSSVGVRDNINQIGFRSFGGGTLAAQYAWSSGGKIIETDGGYNTAVTFSTNGASGTYDLQGIAAQEFGHGFGLGHSSTSSSSACLTMYPYGSSGDTSKRTLGSGDIAGIKARYP